MSGAPAAPRPRRAIGRNVLVLSLVSFLTDVSSEMIYPLLPLFLTGTLHAGASAVGLIEGAAESTAALLKLGSGWWSDRVRRRKPLVVLGYAVSSLARPLVAAAQAASQVLAVRVADRVGKGLRTSPRDALIADSVDPSIRGRAFGLHRAADHAGAVVGPLVAFAILRWRPETPLRSLFWLAAVPGVLAVIALAWGVKEAARAPPAARSAAGLSGGMGRRFWAYLAVLLVFTLGNASDAFLLLRASQLGIGETLLPVLWAMLHVVKSVSSTPGGMLSDRLGRKPLIVVGWIVYAGVYVLFGRASAPWHVWALFAVYGLYFGLTEGVEKALVADLASPERRGAAYGWYNLALGVGALPASLVFGLVWDRFGSSAAFAYGAGLAFAAAVALLVVVPAPRHA